MSIKASFKNIQRCRRVKGISLRNTATDPYNKAISLQHNLCSAHVAVFTNSASKQELSSVTEKGVAAKSCN